MHSWSRRAAVALLAVASACTTSPPAPQGRIPIDSTDDFPKKTYHAAGDTIVRSPVALERFDGCTPVLSHLRNEALKRLEKDGVGGIAGLLGGGIGYGFGGDVVVAERSASGSVPAAMPATADSAAGGADYFSTTNVQEAGIDEPDMVKSDGSRILALARGTLHWVSVTDGRPRLAGTLKLPGYAQDLLVAGDRAVVFSGEWGGPVDALGKAWETKPRVSMHVVELSDPRRMRIVTTLYAEGSLVSSRMIDGVARVVIRSAPSGIAITFPENPSKAARDAAAAKNRREIRRSTLDSWLPEIVVDDRRGPTRRVSRGLLGGCDAVHHPKQFGGFGSTTVMTLDPAHPTPRGVATVLGDAEIVYATAQRLYVSINKWEERRQAFDAVARSGAPATQPVQPAVTTQIHAFDISDAAQARYVAAGTVTGHVLNQFSFSEHEGVLRVASTVERWTAQGVNTSESYVTTLAARAGALVQLGRVGGLGKGERIYAVRFLGDLGYVVTFRQVDPLYVVDLRDPSKPVVRGELKIPGFSAYLHPIGDGLLIGVGGAATTEGRRTGMQISLFDVNDPANPKQVSVRTIENAYTEAEHQHHAFLWWPARKTLVLPVNGPVGRVAGSGDEPYEQWGAWAEGFRIDVASGIERLGKIVHEGRPDPSNPSYETIVPVQRALVIGDRLFTLSEVGLMASTLDDLDRTAWIAWPAP